MDKPTIKLKTLYFNEADYNFYQVLEVPNPNGTTVQYRVKIICTEFTPHKEKILSILTTVFNDTIHPLVSKTYDLSQKQENTLTFYPELLVVNEAKDWSLSGIEFRLDHNTIKLQVTREKAYIRYETSNCIKEPSLVASDQRYIDGSYVIIKVDTRNPVGDVYRVAYKYCMSVAKSPRAILEGIDDIFVLHCKHMLL
jgi:hypothetical protein